MVFNLINFFYSKSFFISESGFVYVSSITFWIDLFVHHFVKSNDLSHDDLLFFVRKKQTKGTKYIPRYEV